MNDNQPVSPRVEFSAAQDPRLVRLRCLAAAQGDAARDAVVARLLTSGRSAAQTPASAFSSSI
ncbi:MAG TPA: hypothetical protein VFU74_11360 [Actinocrinis sp.]|nr:hypothetical protein [Actinocrinis sp.]